MLTFYFNTSPNPTKVALFLEEAGLAYEPRPIDTRKGEQFDAAYLAINPNGKVPAIVDGDATVFDSNAILLYLAEKTGKFLPPETAANRGQLLSWLMFVATGVGPYSGQAVHFTHFAPEKVPYAQHRYEFEALRHFGVLEAHLTATPLHGWRDLYDRRHGCVGLGTGDPVHLGCRGVGEVPEPEAPGRRDRGAACGAAGARAEGPVHVQGRAG